MAEGSAPLTRILGRAADRRAGSSIRDFLTDGSLAALCANLTDLLGVRVELRDEREQLIVFEERDDRRPWRIDESAPFPPAEARRVPLSAGEDVIGSLVVYPGTPSARRGSLSRENLEAVIEHLAHTASELCAEELTLWHRVKEVEMMYRLSALLVRIGGSERVLAEALASALDVMELDAGSVVLLPEDEDPASLDERHLELKASRGLSREWLEHPHPLSKNHEFDKRALEGEIVVAPDLEHDSRVLIPERVRAEGVKSFIGAGLVFQGRPIGVFRLYSRTLRTFSEADVRLLRSVAEHSAVAVQQARTLKILEEERETQRQLQIAADVQRRMLPQATLKFPGFDAAARWVPSHRVGGDFYDAFEDERGVSLVVGDVVGNGIAAALLMASVRSTLRAYAGLGLAVEEIVGRVNQAMCRDSMESEFVTLWYGRVDRATRTLQYVSAGHEPPLLVRTRNGPPADADATPLNCGGLVIGVRSGETYDAGHVRLESGDVIVAYTDGLPEATSFARERFGTRRIRQAVLAKLREEPRAPASAILEHVLWELRQFVGINAKLDDQTLVVVRIE